jgi:hypothetical protein
VSYVIEDAFPGNGVPYVFVSVGCEDIGKERVRTFGRLVLALDVVPKCSFSLFNVRCAEPCATVESAVDDEPGFTAFVPVEARA